MVRFGLPLLIGLLFLSHPSRAQDWHHAARAALDAKEWDEAIEIVDPVVEADPANLQARLFRAIAYREKADFVFDNIRAQYYLDPKEVRAIREATHAMLDGEPWELDFGSDYDMARAMLDFEVIIAADASFDGVLDEYAQLYHDHHVFDRAIELEEAQLRFSPDLADAHEELVATYRHYVASTAPDEAVAWLQEHGSPYAEYFVGEVARREGLLEKADVYFAALLEGSPDIPRQPILISRAKIRIEQGRYREAYAFIEEAMAFETPVEARLLYRDFFYVMDEAEYGEAQTLSTVEAYRDFYDRLWARRNPTPASRVNWRLVEHYRRLVVAEEDFEYFGPRAAFRPPGDRNAAATQPRVPPMYWEAHGFNDKGLIYIRHGEPDEKIATVSANQNESWRYIREGLDFHFYISTVNGIAYSWPLVTYLDGCLAVDRQHWGPLYSQVAPRATAGNPRRQMGNTMTECGAPSDPVGVVQARQRLAKAGQERIARGLRTDRHTWETREIESFGFPFDLLAFRGRDGQTDLTVYFAMPVGRFSAAVPSTVLPVELGFALHDSTWHPVVQRQEIYEFEASTDDTKAGFSELHATVPPDLYRVSLNAALMGSDLFGGYQFGRVVPDYSGSETMMSDVVQAYDIRPKPGHVPSVRSSLEFIANPFHRYGTDQPVHVFFELYRLRLDADDRAHYQITYLIQPVPKRGVRGLFDRDDPALSVSASFDDATPSPIAFSQLDVSELEAGDYTLVVRVLDLVSGTEMARQVPLELVAP